MNLFENILSIDFETAPDGEIYQIGAVFGDKTFFRKEITDIKAAFADLSEFGKNADYVLGHNIVGHDLAIAKPLSPEAGFLTLPIIDTLFLSPLAFPENPYHRLVKDYKLVKTSKNDPVADARLARTVFDDQKAAFSEMAKKSPDLMAFFAFAFETAGFGPYAFPLKGNFDLFHFLAQTVPDPSEARDIFTALAGDQICTTGLDRLWPEYAASPTRRPALAYVLSWVRVAGGNSIIPPWVRHAFPETARLIRHLRYSCQDPACAYCQAHNHSETLLKKYFGFESYRTLSDGRTLQKEIIDATLCGTPLLGILPTGGGKSICYQIPALHRHERLGQLTVVVSPLKALMKDQVDNLNTATGMETAAAINGSLTLPERGAVMEKVRLGDIGILYISPEQLRNYSVADLIASREVGCWVFDEAHCLSKWGHDFRPDYLHVAEFIAACNQKNPSPALVSAFTATAKADVMDEILGHLQDTLSLRLEKFIGGVDRDNLNF